jgi:hypothetical protein
MPPPTLQRFSALHPQKQEEKRMNKKLALLTKEAPIHPLIFMQPPKV